MGFFNFFKRSDSKNAAMTLSALEQALAVTRIRSAWESVACKQELSCCDGL